MNKINDKIIAFLTDIEPNSMAQLINISEMPFLYKWLAVMPDCHLGRGATVGSVIATKGAIIPAAVGVDIGCGMIAVKTRYSAKDLPDNLDEVRNGIERRIPLSAGGFNGKLSDTAQKRVDILVDKSNMKAGEYDKVDSKWQLAIGTLGSGNHFIEICLDR